jgi:IPT/TIG domain
MDNIPRIDNAKLSAIEIRIIGPHYAHSVTGGPYTAVDTDGNGFATVLVDGSESHTHGPDETLVAFVWKKGTTVLARGEVTSLTLPVGEHTISLLVTDTSGDENTDSTVVTVLPYTFPEITSISPTSGSVVGGTPVTITGFGFSHATSVRFGTTILYSTSITIINATTIKVKSPLSAISAPAYVSVITPTGESNTKKFNYDSAITIQFDESKLFDIEEPTAIVFGPDSRLYVGNLKGKLGRYTMNSQFDTVISSIVTTVNPSRGIHGIAFDPLDDGSTTNPTVYISTSDIFHNEGQNSFGDAINGKIQAVSGANLDIITDVVTGLPVSALDHSVSSHIVDRRYSQCLSLL